MMHIDRRQLLIALAALASGTGALLAADAPAPGCTPLDVSKGKEIGAAWRAANPGVDLETLRIDLLPQGACEESLAPLADRVREDFRQGRLFIYRGWRLAETEARLFALATGN